MPSMNPRRKGPKKTVRPTATKKKSPRPTAPARRAAAADLAPAPAPAPADIPWGYGVDRITAMARDPHNIFAYWEITDAGIDDARRRLGDPHAGCALRVYETTHKLFDGLNANAHWDHGVDRGTNQYYIRTGRPGATFHVDVGVLGHGGSFAPIARSGACETPRDSVSPDARAEWSTVFRSGPGYSYRHRHTPRPGGTPPLPQAPCAADPRDLEAVFQHLAGDGWTRSEWVETTMDGRVVRWIRWSGPFSTQSLLPEPAGTYRRVEVLFQGERRVVRFEQGERFVYGPWRIAIEAVGPRGERRTIDRWMVRHRWTTGEGVARIETPAILLRILGGERVVFERSGSESRLRREDWGSEFLQLGASEWRWRGASETLLAGASEVQALGATETLFMGATEIRSAGASEQLWTGASERLGGSEVWELGASEGMP